MPKIHLTKELNISTQLFSRLASKGLLNSCGEPAEDLYLYIQECLARDDNRYPITLTDQNITPLKTISECTVSKESADPEPRLSVDAATIRERMSKLYSGG